MFCLRTFCLYERFVPPDVLSLRTFCPYGCCVPTDVLSLRTFCLYGRFVPWTFCPTDVMSPAVLSPDVLSPDVLSLRTFCLRTFCLRTFCLGIVFGAHLDYNIDQMVEQPKNCQSFFCLAGGLGGDGPRGCAQGFGPYQPGYGDSISQQVTYRLTWKLHISTGDLQTGMETPYINRWQTDGYRDFISQHVTKRRTPWLHILPGE